MFINPVVLFCPIRRGNSSSDGLRNWPVVMQLVSGKDLEVLLPLWGLVLAGEIGCLDMQ